MLKYILSISLVIALAGCCATNYSSQMKEILKPMEKELIAFYKKNNRYPTTAEHYKLLEKVGCKIVNNKCLYKGNKFDIEIPRHANGGNIGLLKGNSDCYISLTDGKKDIFNCHHKSCFDLGLRQ